MLRVLGGVAVYLRCPSARRIEFARRYGDIDFIGHASQASEIKGLLVGLGYVPQERFNAMHGNRRLLFLDAARQRRVDVFLDVFEMSHRFDLKERMEIDPQTITLADLLATKLQIIQTNEKDVGDSICILVDHETGVGDASGVISEQRLARLCAEDWGIYKTFTTKLAMLNVAVERWKMSEADIGLVRGRIERLIGTIERVPKAFQWRLRAVVGERVRWYELPEEDVPTFGVLQENIERRA